MDKYLVSLAVVLLFLECGWLLNDLDVIELPGLHHGRGTNSGMALGEITQRKREVKKRSSNSLVWEETYDEQNLYAYDSILTLDQSTAEVNLGGQSLITLQENTLVTIEPPAQDNQSGPVRLHFKQGSMRTNLADGLHTIDVGDWVVEAGAKTQVTIRSSGENKFEIETHAGSVKVVNQKTATGSQTVKAGEILSISAGEISDVKEALEIKWDEPADGTRIYTHGAAADVSLRWQGVAIDAVVTETVKSKAEAIPLVLGTDGGQKLPLAKGNYVVQLRNSERTTFARNIAVWEAPKIHLISPLTRQRIKLGNPVEFIWTMSPDVKTYQWQVAADPEFKNIMRSGKTAENKITVNDLPLGEFYWRVVGQDDKGFEIPEMYFNTFNIVVSPLDAPKLKAPSVLPDESLNFWNWIIPEAEADEVISEKRIPKHYKAIFEWEPVQGADSYSIEISETPDFRNPVIKEVTRAPRYKWKDFKLGQYYWRVAAQSDTGEMGLFSEIALADLLTIPVKPIMPISVDEAKALQLAKALATPASAPAINPAPTPALVPTPKPTPPLEPKMASGHWVYEAKGGGHGIGSFFKGNNFQATQVGGALGDFRFSVVPPQQKTNWRFEGEFQTENLNASSVNYPFQNILTAQTYRLTAINENPLQGQRSLGFSVHNQNFIFQRTDLEVLSLQTPWSVGPFFDWHWIHNGYESEYRLGAFLGTASSLEARAMRTHYFSISKPLDLTLSLDAKLTAGVTTSGSFWTDGTVYIFLGVRWK